MNYVQPIRDKKKIQTMKTVLKAKDEKYYIMFLVGINVGLRISDILTLKVSDVRDRTHINIVEKKTGKTKRFLLNSKMQAELTDYISKFSLSDDDYLIRSRKGKNRGAVSCEDDFVACFVFHDNCLLYTGCLRPGEWPRWPM